PLLFRKFSDFSGALQLVIQLRIAKALPVGDFLRTPTEWIIPRIGSGLVNITFRQPEIGYMGEVSKHKFAELLLQLGDDGINLAIRAVIEHLLDQAHDGGGLAAESYGIEKAHAVVGPVEGAYQLKLLAIAVVRMGLLPPLL